MNEPFRVSEIVASGIGSLAGLRDALQLAVQLEFSTIPPYLCAQWSVKADPDRVEGIVHRVVSEEMEHMALVGNLMSAIGFAPKVAHESFVWNYPANELPGGIVQNKPVDLKPLHAAQLQVFMQIEHPDFPPVAFVADDKPATIGEFYDTIIEAFKALKPKINPNAHTIPVFDSEPVSDLAGALRVLETIKSEGEGLKDSPEQPTSPRSALAHYYAFKEVLKQKKLVERNGKWSFTGAPVRQPEVYQFRQSEELPSPSTQFNRVFTQLLFQIESCWNRGEPLDVVSMLELKVLGIELIRNGIRPEFKWDATRKP